MPDTDLACIILGLLTGPPLGQAVYFAVVLIGRWLRGDPLMWVP